MPRVCRRERVGRRAEQRLRVRRAQHRLARARSAVRLQAAGAEARRVVLPNDARDVRCVGFGVQQAGVALAAAPRRGVPHAVVGRVAPLAARVRRVRDERHGRGGLRQPEQLHREARHVDKRRARRRVAQRHALGEQRHALVQLVPHDDADARVPRGQPVPVRGRGRLEGDVDRDAERRPRHVRRSVARAGRPLEGRLDRDDGV